MSEIKDLLAGFPVIVEQAVVWGDMDSYRHVNNVVYFRYFENVRVEYLRRIGWEEIEQETKVGPIVSSVSAKFRKPLTYPDTISVGSRLETMGEDRFTLEHIIVSHAKKAVTTHGHSTVVTLNYAHHQKVPIPDLMRQRIRDLENQIGQ